MKPRARGGLAEHYRIDAVRAHLLEMSGDRDAAIRHYRMAARSTQSTAEREYLDRKADALATRT